MAQSAEGAAAAGGTVTTHNRRAHEWLGAMREDQEATPVVYRNLAETSS